MASTEGTDRPPQADVPTAHWNPVTRIAFRFTFLYFGLFCLIYPDLIFEFLGRLGKLFPTSASYTQALLLKPVISWIGSQVFGIDVVAHEDSISGDQTYFWVLLLLILSVALVGTIGWTALDRRRGAYIRAHTWLLLFLRLCLAGQFLAYGLAKVIPTQMPPPPLARLVQPYGQFSPMAVLWNQIGVSQPYEILLGTAELTAGLLLFLPRTALVGAMLGLVCSTQVFVIDMTYDVSAKIISGHLVLLCLILLAPHARRLFDVLVLNRTPGPAPTRPPLSSVRGNRIAVLLQAALGIWLLTSGILLGLQRWDSGPGAPEPALYGIWDVTEFVVDGTPAPPLTTDENRWQRVIFDKQNATIQRMDSSGVPVLAVVDANRIAMAMFPQQPGAAPTPLAHFTFERPMPDLLRLDGESQGHRVTMSLRRIDPNSFPLRARGFHWRQEYPYFR
ncbi:MULTISPECIES: DoxX family protein [unclassified Nocardia]|uniref:DoxX family protein n=1 Tax=unclassified Nocardia TaxID=2637762 RepID=UPI001CE4082D|nr:MULTISPECIES: DoxX family protein [unclassified Nocardia]